MTPEMRAASVTVNVMSPGCIVASSKRRSLKPARTESRVALLCSVESRRDESDARSSIVRCSPTQVSSAMSVNGVAVAAISNVTSAARRSISPMLFRPVFDANDFAIERALAVPVSRVACLEDGNSDNPPSGVFVRLLEDFADRWSPPGVSASDRESKSMIRVAVPGDGDPSPWRTEIRPVSLGSIPLSANDSARSTSAAASGVDSANVPPSAGEPSGESAVGFASADAVSGPAGRTVAICSPSAGERERSGGGTAEEFGVGSRVSAAASGTRSVVPVTGVVDVKSAGRPGTIRSFDGGRNVCAGGVSVSGEGEASGGGVGGAGGGGVSDGGGEVARSSRR